MTTPELRVSTHLGNLQADLIPYDSSALGTLISDLISDVGQINYVSTGDIRVFGPAAGTPPRHVEEAMRFGTKFFDAVFYFAADVSKRPQVQAGADMGERFKPEVVKMKCRLLWTAVFLMLRGSYPSSEGNAIGSDVPAFLVNIAGMNESPSQVAAGLASFPLLKISTEWVRAIQWSVLAPSIRQRLALGLAGYRLLGPFKIYQCRADCPQDALDAFIWARNIATRPPDYKILSATRSAELIARLGSWNKALGNLMLIVFSAEQLQEMVQNKIIFQMPVRDPRADTWRTWSSGAELVLDSPIGL